MTSLFIQKVIIDWQKISKDSYLRDIDALQGLEELELTSPVTFFAGENGTREVYTLRGGCGRIRF